MAPNLKNFLKHFELTVWVIRRRPKYSKKSSIFSTLVALATIQLINLGLTVDQALACKAPWQKTTSAFSKVFNKQVAFAAHSFNTPGVDWIVANLRPDARNPNIDGAILAIVLDSTQG